MVMIVSKIETIQILESEAFSSILFCMIPSRKCAWSSTPSIFVLLTGEITESCSAVPDSPIRTYFHSNISIASYFGILSTSTNEYHV